VPESSSQTGDPRMAQITGQRHHSSAVRGRRA
jgi:hypothetical protein